MKTFEELERTAYIAGDIELAQAYAAMDTLERLDADLPLGFDFETPMGQQIENLVETETAKNCPDYTEYKEFFYECFTRLNGHYPYPSVTSDYDKSIIFNAIERGEGMTE